MTFFLALDPGETTGWATFNSEHGYRSGDVKREFLWDYLETTLFTNHPVLIVESFRPDPPFDPSALEVIGVIKEWARQNHITIGPNQWQRPDQAKHFWTDERLREYNVYHPSSKHARDAMRHLWYYLAFTLHMNIISKGGEAEKENLPGSQELTDERGRDEKASYGFFTGNKYGIRVPVSGAHGLRFTDDMEPLEGEAPNHTDESPTRGAE